MAKKANRQAELARIHIAKKELGMNEDEYRTMLHEQTGKDSAGKLTDRQRYIVLDHMKALKEGPKKSYPGRPSNMDGYSSRDRQLKKIEALLTVGGKPWAYADFIAKKMCKVDFVAWVPDNELYKIITAIERQGIKEGWDIKR